MTMQALRMLNYLRKHHDSLTEVDKSGIKWAQVYSADIDVKGINKNQNAGYLSALEKVGFYKKVDEYFGMVRL